MTVVLGYFSLSTTVSLTFMSSIDFSTINVVLNADFLVF